MKPTKGGDSSMEDVNNQENVQESTPQEGPAEQDTASENSQAQEQTVENAGQSVTQEAQERMVPISVVQKERKQRQQLQRELAELKGSQQLNQYDPNDMEGVLAHPYVQELMIKQAKQELTDFTREALEEYPNLHPQLKKGILSNVRGFVKETTQDVEAAKLDIIEYIEGLAEEAEAQAAVTPNPKEIKVASTNVTNVTPATRPADIARILAKPVDEMTETEMKIVDDYRKANPTK